MKRSAVKPLLKESMQNAMRRIPLDLWAAIASLALNEARPAREIVIDALNEYLRTATRRKKNQRKLLRVMSHHLSHHNGRKAQRPVEKSRRLTTEC